MNCSVDKCNLKVHAKGMCNKHYRRVLKFGKTEIDNEREYGYGNGKHYLYPTWVMMKDRCFNSNNNHYHNYGARGITVCDRWKNSFQSFLFDMGDRPEGLTLDRVDNSGNYEPGNCRWANYVQQANNRNIRKDNKTGYRGICFNKQIDKFVVRRQNRITGKRDYIGCSDTLAEAVMLYESAKPKN